MNTSSLALVLLIVGLSNCHPVDIASNEIPDDVLTVSDGGTTSDDSIFEASSSSLDDGTTTRTTPPPTIIGSGDDFDFGSGTTSDDVPDESDQPSDQPEYEYVSPPSFQDRLFYFFATALLPLYQLLDMKSINHTTLITTQGMNPIIMDGVMDGNH